MYEIGRICVKLAGRDAGLKCVIVDLVDAHFVVIAGQTRYRKCNVKHLEPTDKMLPIKLGASVHDIAKAFKEMGVIVVEKKNSKKTAVAAPKRKRVAKSKPVKEVKAKVAPKKTVKAEKVADVEDKDLKD